MIERWMLSAILLGVILTLGGLCVAHFCPRFGIPRRWLWLGLMVLSVSLPVVMAFDPTTPRPEPQATDLKLSCCGEPGGPSLRPGRGEATLAAAPAPRNIDEALLIGWGVASLALALFLVGVHRRMLSQLAPLQTRDVLGHTVTVSPDFGPAAVGLIRSRVVLPEWVFDLPVEEQRLVLRHEQQHIDAGDHFVLLAGIVMTVLMPWNLGLWWQLRRLRVGMELDCDARVAPRAADRPRYGQLLLQSRRRSRSYHAALAFVPTPSVLAERLYALLESARLSRRQMATWGISAIACAAVVTRVPVPSVRALFHSAVPLAPLSTASPIVADLPTGAAAVRPAPLAGSALRTATTHGAAGTTVTTTRIDEAQKPIDTAATVTRPSPRYDILQPIEPGMLRAPVSRGYRASDSTPKPSMINDSTLIPVQALRATGTGAGGVGRIAAGVRRMPPDSALPRIR